MVREGRVFISPTSNPAYGIGYYVQALEVGAQVTSASSGTTVTVRAGHGFAAGDKYMNGTDVTTFSGTLTVQSITSTTLVLSSAYAVSEGDLLVNLGADTGTSEPNYDGAGLTIYTDMDYSNVASRNTVLTDQYGRYRYWHKGIARWELVRSATGLVALYTDAAGIILEASSYPVATDYPLTDVTDVLMKWYRTGDANPLLSFTPIDPADQYAQLLRVGDRAQTTGDARSLGYFSATINAPGAKESQAVYGINVYTGAATASQMGVFGMAQSLPGDGNTIGTIVGTQGFAWHSDDGTGITTNVMGVSASAGTSAAASGTVSNLFGVRGAANPRGTVAVNNIFGVYGIAELGSSSVGSPTVTNAYAGFFNQPTIGVTANYAVALGGESPSLGFQASGVISKFLKWSVANTRFEFSSNVYVPGSIVAAIGPTGPALTAQTHGTAISIGDATDNDLVVSFNTATTDGTITYTGATTNEFAFSRSVTSGGHIRGAKATEALTTSAAIATVNRTLIDITNTSGTNTPTLVAPSSVDGQILILRCVVLTDGTITLADSGTCSLSAAWVPSAGDTLTLIASGSVWYETARSANA